MPVLRRALAANILVIYLVHHQNIIELFEILAADLARTQRAQIEPPQLGCRLCALIGLAAYVVAVGAGGIDMDMLLQSALDYKVFEYALRCRRAANVTHANK